MPTLTLILLILEVLVFVGAILGKFLKIKISETKTFLFVVFLICLCLNFMPALYDVIVLKEKTNWFMLIVERLTASLKFFVGKVDLSSAKEFMKIAPLYSYAYVLGALIAILTTITTVLGFFSNTLVNKVRVLRLMKKETCDIVVGQNDKACEYTKNSKAILLCDNLTKDKFNQLVEDGFVVINKELNETLLNSKLFNLSTRYNVICFEEDKTINILNTFISYSKQSSKDKNIHLYLEVDDSKKEVIHKQIIDKSGFSSVINTFSINELKARKFSQENPITKYLPNDFVTCASLNSDVLVNVFLLGFDNLGKQIYRQLILNNQLVTFENNEYKLLPINYHLFDSKINGNIWEIDGLKNALSNLDKDKYFTLPEMPYNTTLHSDFEKVIDLSLISNCISNKKSFSYIIINTNDEYNNVKIASDLANIFGYANNYHIFVKSNLTFVKNEENISYFNNNNVYTHDVIVNDSLSIMAKKINEVYVAQNHPNNEEPDHENYIQKIADDAWKNLDCFTLASNVYSSMSLRVKLNLLGLDYIDNNKTENLELIDLKYPVLDDYKYEDYFKFTVRNSLLAQEHARWNAYHLLNEYLPLEKNKISLKSKHKFNIKDTKLKRHACLTTFKGLDELSTYLSDKINGELKPSDYDYYVYDELLIKATKEIMKKLKYSLIEK